jgi:predicted small lipoprotein YifL
MTVRGCSCLVLVVALAGCGVKKADHQAVVDERDEGPPVAGDDHDLGRSDGRRP